MNEETPEQKKTMRERRIELWKARVLKARLKGEKPPKYGQTVLTKIKILLHRLSSAELYQVDLATEAVRKKRARENEIRIQKLIPYCEKGDTVEMHSGKPALIMNAVKYRHKYTSVIYLSHGYWLRKTSTMGHVKDIPAAAARMEAEKAAKKLEREQKRRKK